MVLGQVGFLTTVVESAATAVAGGIVLGGFLAGSVGIVTGRQRPLRDERIATCGYAGGMAAVLAVAIDLVLRYI